MCLMPSPSFGKWLALLDQGEIMRATTRSRGEGLGEWWVLIQRGLHKRRRDVPITYVIGLAGLTILV